MSRSKIRIFASKSFYATSLFVSIFSVAAYAESIGNLAGAKVGKFPSSWRTWPFERGKAAQVYSVQEEGQMRYLHAKDDSGASAQIFYRFVWDLAKNPKLSWKWRPKMLPAGAREDNGNLNDSACGVYIIFGGYNGQALKYVWSTTLPAGTVVTRRGGKLKIKVVSAGPGGVGSWHSVSVSAPDDYKALFGSAIDKSAGIAVLTDGNATKTTAECDYADFRISN